MVYFSATLSTIIKPGWQRIKPGDNDDNDDNDDSDDSDDNDDDNNNDKTLSTIIKEAGKGQN